MWRAFVGNTTEIIDTNFVTTEFVRAFYRALSGIEIFVRLNFYVQFEPTYDNVMIYWKNRPSISHKNAIKKYSRKVMLNPALG